MVSFLPLLLSGIGGAAVGASSGGGGLLSQNRLASPDFDFSRSASTVRTFAPTTSTQSTFTDSRTISIITGSPNARANLSPATAVSPATQLIPTIIPSATRDIGIPVSTGGGGGGVGSPLLLLGLGGLAVFLLTRRGRK